MHKKLICLSAAAISLLVSQPVYAQPYQEPPTPDNPAIAVYRGGNLRLQDLEEYANFVTKIQRVPRLADGQIWREHMSKELVKQVLFTSVALETNLFSNPALLRARNYYVQEWMSYALLRDNVVNKIEVDVPKLKAFFESHRDDYFVSGTVSLRMIRIKDAAKAQAAWNDVAAGKDFETVQKEKSELNLRQRTAVLGPFPTTETVTQIPPPKEVIKLAEEMNEGESTGPVLLYNNYFIVQTVQKTPSFKPEFEDVVQFVETRIRQMEGDNITRKFLKELENELAVEYADDSVLQDPKTRPEDIIATVGTVLVPLDEYVGLNAKVRGPAMEASNLQPTQISRFCVPILLAEAGKLRGYHERKEFQSALFFHDLKRFGQRALDNESDRKTPRITEEDIRKHYEAHLHEKDEHGHTLEDLPIEHARESIRDVLWQTRRGDTEKMLVEKALTDANFHMAEAPTCTRLTGFEAYVAAYDAGKVPPGYKVRMISTYPGPEQAQADERAMEPTPYMTAGRREKWKFTCTNDTDSSDILEFVWDKPARIYDGTDKFTSHPLYTLWGGIWRFDTDSLIRHAYDSGVTDFFAKNNDNCHVNTRVEFDWDGRVPKDCWIVFELRPLANPTQVLTLRYSTQTGSLTRKPIEECLPCEQMKRILNEPL